MKILVIGSCGKKKQVQHPKAPSCNDLLTNDSLSKWRSRLIHSVHPARNMYTGYQHRELLMGIEGLRSIKGVEVDMFIISAGFGVLNEDEMIPPYECSFSSLKKAEILERAEALGIEDSVASICRTEYDLLYIALSKKYMLTLGEHPFHDMDGVAVVFHHTKADCETVYVPSGSATVKSFSQQGFKIHGVVGFKGDLLRILSEFAMKQKFPSEEVRTWTNPIKLESLIYELGDLEHKSSGPRSNLYSFKPSQ